MLDSLRLVMSEASKAVRDDEVAIPLEQIMKEPNTLQQDDAGLIKVSYE